MSNSPAYDDWLTKQQASQLLGVAEKTIDRLAARGEIQKATRQRPGLSPVTVFHPADIARVKAERERSPAPFVMPPTVDVRPVSDTSNLDTSESLVRHVPDNVSDMLKVMTRQRFTHWPLWLHEEAAVAYSGLGLHYLRTAVTWERRGPRGARVCRRIDLEKL